jgi:hypothetical protein
MGARALRPLLLLSRRHELYSAGLCRFSSISIVAAFQAKFIFNVYSDFAVINYSPLKIRCFFGFTAMPRTRRRRVIKRQMYGRAGFELLRARVLPLSV